MSRFWFNSIQFNSISTTSINWLDHSLAAVDLLSGLGDGSQDGVIVQRRGSLDVDKLRFEVCIDALDSLELVEGSSDGARAA